ncbi:MULTISPECIES: hypothetical protein [Halobacterium]|uniref:Uncharacterized protein n=4 Tax=Halobacterium salinarum TaxID=2242 RepID=Q9HPF3_HALSA|nr:MULTISPECIES: hypothetical protein [Halobacterium]AAG19916.1 hypothetical protein VNG_1664H [Halobacterium salinarum NRC-1]MBB6088921.1 hypothetical protein [Halobacterium salinarum]MCF2164862.1 hypothetical protein [Halobacterium salinarum]MCF2168513.1 hypothetical protein [Halobacterium salinarum]MCF2207439.1 hypothetical protein [Halobacterium salinarum]
MRFDFTRAVGLLAAFVAVGMIGLSAADVMPARVMFMMVLPSMIVFAAISFLIGMKHGEHRITG